MPADVVREFFRRRLFEPFQIRLSSGNTYRIEHPEMAMMTKSTVVIAFPDSDRTVTVSLLHVADIEIISNSPAA